MKNISFSQYKREMQEISSEGEASLIDAVDPPTESTKLVRKVEMLTRELQNFRRRERLLCSTNDSLTKALDGMKLQDSSCRQLLEECK